MCDRRRRSDAERRRHWLCRRLADYGPGERDERVQGEHRGEHRHGVCLLCVDAATRRFSSHPTPDNHAGRGNGGDPETAMTHERGQVLVITAVAMVVLLGVAALVVDLGMSWMLRRQEQNAADPGAIAAARWLRDPVTGAATLNPPAMKADACMYAQANDFFVGDTNCAAALASGALQVKSPPTSGTYSGQPGKVQVIITAEHPSFFGRIFGRSSARVTTAAVASNDADNANSSSLVALKPDCSGGAS